MNKNTSFARKSTLAAAIAVTLAAAAPAFAATSAPSEWAGYPTGDSVRFDAQPASLATTAPIDTSASTATVTDVQTTTVMPADQDTTRARDEARESIGTYSPEGTAATPAATPATEPTVIQQTWVVVPLASAPDTATQATLPQWQQPEITRASVRADLLAARADGTLTPTGEVGDTEQTLAARQAFNEEQTDAIVAVYQAEYDRQVAMQEAEIRRAAIEADWLMYGVAQNPASYDDPTAEVQIDVISMEPLGVGE